MKSDIIYLKLEQNSQVSHKKVLLEDVAEILTADQTLQKESGKLVLYTFSQEKEQKLVFSAMKVIELLQKQRPGLQVINIGEPDFIVEYKDTPKLAGRLEIVKVLFWGLIIFFGAGFTIMTFNTDVSVGDVFSLFYRLVMGTEQTSKDHGRLLLRGDCHRNPRLLQSFLCLGMRGMIRHRFIWKCAIMSRK